LKSLGREKVAFSSKAQSTKANNVLQFLTIVHNCEVEMDIRKDLSLEQQFELQVFEQQVQKLSQQDAHVLLVQLKEAMLYQTTAFREILKEAWGIGSGIEVIGETLAEG
jgi:hypothetical protein